MSIPNPSQPQIAMVSVYEATQVWSVESAFQASTVHCGSEKTSWRAVSTLLQAPLCGASTRLSACSRLAKVCGG
ncbi:Tyrosine-Protein Kinase Abl1 [Manis pentadactyla]|nr:Tyrosine-Protein Kinase Abl1 [Manis pentadactyla]